MRSKKKMKNPLLLGGWTFGLLDGWTVGLLDGWTVGLLDCWTVGLFGVGGLGGWRGCNRIICELGFAVSGE
jgi:hypothetical protein